VNRYQCSIGAIVAIIVIDRAAKVFFPPLFTNEYALLVSVLLSAVIIGGLVVFFFYGPQSPMIMPASLIIAGGIGNMIDRLWHGHVIDMFAIGPVFFNIADIGIVVGCIWLTLCCLGVIQWKA
jgi:signal peptidase II